MKTLVKIVIFCFVLTTFMGCGTPQKTDETYTITKIKAEKDGQTLFLMNRHGKIYTTIISFPNGNYFEANVGDVITLEVEEILDMDPPAIISKNIKVVNKN
tara:strand:+ start:18444 stop:18746 length:303 start_codon:yes stop_codon:yes gene_type:complete